MTTQKIKLSPLAVLVAVVIGVFLRIFTAMLLIGAAHHELDVRIPALGFWQTALLVVTIHFLAPLRQRAK